MTSRFLRRNSLSVDDYDYSKEGAYFVTICVRKRESLLGSVLNGKIRLNVLGETVAKVWQWLSCQYPQVDLDEWQIMPNHLHGIVWLRDESHLGLNGIKPKPLGRLLGAFKTVSTKNVNEIRQMTGLPFWQRNFYEHIIRDEDSLNRIREYILTNPQRWELDRENPKAIGKDDFDSWLFGFNYQPPIS